MSPSGQHGWRWILLSCGFLYVQWTPLCQAWSLADRVSGRAFPPHEPNRHQRVRIRRRLRVHDIYDEDTSLRDRSIRGATSISTKHDAQSMLTFMESGMESLVGDLELPPNLPEQDELANFVRCIVRAADGRKGENIVALRVRHCTTLTSFIILVSGNSRPQNQAISSAILKDVEAAYHVRPGGNGVPEGSAESGWILLDYGSAMVHIMAPKSRLFYNIEGQWRDRGGEYMDLSGVLIPNSPTDVDRKEPESKQGHEDDDPFWS